MKVLVMGLVLAMLAGQGFAAEDEKARLLAWVEDEMLAEALADGVSSAVLATSLTVTGLSCTAVTLTVTVAVSVLPAPSVTVYVKLAGPA